MNIHDLRRAQAVFETEIESIMERKKELYKLREAFVRYFSITGIQKMDVDSYVLGKDKPEIGFNFCYGLERQLKGLGWMIGGSSFKFGFYFGRTKTDTSMKYRYVKRFGSSPSAALRTAKRLILDLLKYGANEDIDGIVDNELSPMFKGKILATYFPTRYLNVFASSHLDYFLTKLDLDTDDLLNMDEVIKREALLDYKNSDTVMRKWPVDIYSDFLYRFFGKPTTADVSSKDDPLREYRSPTFPANAVPEFISLQVDPTVANGDGSYPSSVLTSKHDFEKEQRRNRELGSRGEKIVMDLEVHRLRSSGRKDLAKKVKRVSMESDSYGYDVASYEIDGRERFIEVKATSSKVGPAKFFITANELRTALREENFFIYMVYDILSSKPKVWPIKNPFKPKNNGLSKTPVSYRCIIKTL